MKILITGGTGFLGRALARSFLADGHQVIALARHAPRRALPEGLRFVQWDGRTAAGWGGIIDEIDVVINLAGRSLASWPWTRAMKRQFLDSRAQAGRALVEAITQAQHRPRLLVQSSGINHYGLRGETATESTPPAQDFLARVTVEWEASTRGVEELGVRRVITRSAVVLAGMGGLLSLMALPVRLFVGGPLAGGRQAVPWIHLDDEVGAVRFLVEQEGAAGPFNLIAPEQTSNAQFMRAVARRLHRPYWFPTPGFLLRLILGGMSVLVTEGRYSRPERLLALGYRFRYASLEDALSETFAA